MRPLLFTILSLAAQPAAGDISLAFPLDCQLDQDCHIQQFVDHDPSSGASDFACGSLTYDGHKGTDIALPSLAAQAAGVNVLAAASGVVRGARNDMRDVLQGTRDAPDVSERECGNGVVLDHGDGIETQYCHMARGSVVVATGETVQAGQVLGQVGLSGETQFPHLHLSVRRNGIVTDPFDPDGTITCGAISNETLWETRPATPAGGIINSGFSDAVPEFDTIKAGLASPTDMKNTANAMVVWVNIFGGRIGDDVTIIINGPAGEIIENHDILTRTQAQLFRAAGRRTPQGGWPAGRYDATVTMVRDQMVLDRQTLFIDITP